MSDLSQVLERLDGIEAAMTRLLQERQEREHYGVAEFAQAVGRAEFTVREWCRLGRIRAAKRATGRGRAFEWVISHDELLRFRRDGLLPQN